MVDQPASYLCAFCDTPTDDDPRYVHIELPFRSDNAAYQAFGVH